MKGLTVRHIEHAAKIIEQAEKERDLIKKLDEEIQLRTLFTNVKIKIPSNLLIVSL